LPRFHAVTERPPNRIEKLLSYLADVRSGEGATALLLMVDVFPLLVAYYLLKTVREAQSLMKAERTSSAGQEILLMVVVPLYGFVGTKVVRIRLLVGLLLFFAANLVVFYLVGVNGIREGVAFHIWGASLMSSQSASFGRSPTTSIRHRQQPETTADSSAASRLTNRALLGVGCGGSTSGLPERCPSVRHIMS
jgi:hypothetical protein